MDEISKIVEMIRSEIVRRMQTAAYDIATTASADFERKLKARVPEITAAVTLELCNKHWFMDAIGNKLKITIDLNPPDSKNPT